MTRLPCGRSLPENDSRPPVAPMQGYRNWQKTSGRVLFEWLGRVMMSRGLGVERCGFGR